MTEFEKLANLVNSLTPSEKRYMSITLNQETDHWKMYTILQGQKAANENQVAKKLGLKPTQHKFTRIRQYLFSSILTALNNYDYKHSIGNQLTEAIQSIEVLYNRGFYDIASKLARKTRQLADRTEHFEYLLEILRWEGKILLRALPLEEQVIAIQENHEHQVMAINRLQNLNTYVLLERTIQLHFRQKYFSREATDTIEISDPFLEDDDAANSSRAILKRAIVRGTLLFYNGQLAEGMQVYAAAHKWAATVPDLYLMDPESYFSLYHGWMRTAFWFGDIDKMEKLCAFCRQNILKEELPRQLKANMSWVLLNTDFNILYERGHYAELLNILPRLEALMKEHENVIDVQSKELNAYLFSLAYYNNDMMSKAIQNLQPLLNSKPDNVRRDVYIAAQLLQLIIFFDQGSWDLLEYRMKSVYRFLKQRNQLFGLEEALLGAIKKGLSPKFEAAVVFRELKEKLVKLKEDPFERNALRYFPYIEWLDSKLG